MNLVACGWRHTITVTSSGSIYTYGWSKYGQLGHGDFEDHLIPHKLEALSGQIISQVTCYIHCLSLSSRIISLYFGQDERLGFWSLEHRICIFFTKHC